MKDFLFRPEQARTPVSVLSGGERARLILARELAKPSNLLVLDEPTNDLDLETLDMLQEMLADYQGTILLVSHDRDFLDRVASSVLMSEGEGSWTEYAGGYTDMVAQRGAGVAARKVKAATRRRPRLQPGTGAAQGQRKLSFKEKHALETLPSLMKKLEAEIATLEATACRRQTTSARCQGLRCRHHAAGRDPRRARPGRRTVAGTRDEARGAGRAPEPYQPDPPPPPPPPPDDPPPPDPDRLPGAVEAEATLDDRLLPRLSVKLPVRPASQLRPLYQRGRAAPAMAAAARTDANLAFHSFSQSSASA